MTEPSNVLLTSGISRCEIMLPQSYRDDDPIGVKIDVLADASASINMTENNLRDMYVTLDVLADDNIGILTDEERREIREIQQRVETIADACEDKQQAIHDEMDRITN